MKTPSLKSLAYIAVTTPFNHQGLLDEKSLRLHLRFLKRNGICHVLIGGSTGEGTRMSAAQRVLLAKRARAEFDGTVALMVGSTSLEESIALAGSGAEHGINEFVFTLPPGAPSAPWKGLCDYGKKLCEAQPSSRFFFYCHPSVGLPVEFVNDVLGYLIDACPNLAGIKDSIPGSPHLRHVRRCCQCIGRPFLLLTGDDTQIGPNFEDGFHDGVVSGSMNPFPVRLVRYLGALENGRRSEAAAAKEFLQQWVDLIRRPHHEAQYAYGTQEVASIKLGLHLGPLPEYPTRVLAPLAEITRDVDYDAIREFVAAD